MFLQAMYLLYFLTKRFCIKLQIDIVKYKILSPKIWAVVI